MGTPKDSEITRKKLIEAAGRLFAEKGFKGVTVREIVKQADTHLSALNYHFSSKQRLYHETLKTACQSELTTREEKELLRGMPPEKALHVLVDESLKQYQKTEADNWQSALVERESKQPSPFFEQLLKEFYQPEFEFAAEIIGAAAGLPPDSRDVRFAVCTFDALLDSFGLYDHLIEAVSPDLVGSMRKRGYLTKKIVDAVLQAARPM